MVSLFEHPISGKQVGVDYLGTSIFCLAIGVVLWLLGAAEPLWASLAISFWIGYGINTGVATSSTDYLIRTSITQLEEQLDPSSF